MAAAAPPVPAQASWSRASPQARAAATCAGVAVALGGLFDAAWQLGSPQIQALVAGLVRPDLGLAVLLGGLAVLALAPTATPDAAPLSRSRRLLGGAAALGCIGLGVADLGGVAGVCLTRGSTLAADALHRCEAAAAAARMAPLTALLSVVAGLTLLAMQAPAAWGMLRLARAVAYAAVAVCLWAACACLFTLGPARVSGVGTVMSPGGAVGLLCLHLSVALLTTAAGGRPAVPAAHPHARGLRSVYLAAVAALLLGLLLVDLQRRGILSVEEAMAATVIVALAIFLTMVLRDAQSMGRVLEHQSQTLARLEALTGENQQALAALASERNTLASVLAAAVEYMIIATDARGVIRVFNDGAVRILGYCASEVVGQHTPELFHDQGEIAARARELRVAASMAVFVAPARRRDSQTREWTYVTRDGRRIPVALTVTGIFDAAGELTGLVGIARDLTDFKRTEREREAFFERGHELLCRSTITGVLQRVNAAFARTVGYRADELAGRMALDFVHPDDLPPTQAALAGLKRGETLEGFENRWRTRDGGYRWIRWSCVADEADGTVLSSGWDVTAHKAHAEEMAQQAQFEQHLIGIVSHDLRNPINAIALTASLVTRQQPLPPSLARAMRRIGSASARAERMLHDLLDFTAARRGGLRIRRQPVDLDRILAEVVDELRLVHPDRNIELRAWGGGEATLDGDRVAQAVGNLLANALTYSPPDAPVQVRVVAVGQGLAISVHNEGPPIDPALLPQLFAPMRRGAAPTANSGRSVGLGLYIVDQIARAHGGRVTVTSTAAAGTEFHLILDVPTA